MKSFPLHILAFCLFSAFAVSCTSPADYITVTGFAQGGTYAVKLNPDGVHGPISKTPAGLKHDIDSILHDIDNSLSGYNSKSQLSAFNAGKKIHPSEIFLDIYTKSYEMYESTDSVVDAASAPLYDAWGFGFKSGEMPSTETVDSIRLHSGMKLLRKNIRDRVLPDGGLYPGTLLKDNDADLHPALNYNAVAQGYSCDLVAAYLKKLGVIDMMVDIGEIFCQGHNPKGQPWTIAIDTPADNNNHPGEDICGIFTAPEKACGVVTSGNYRKFYVRDGKKYAHTIDPRTGYPVSHNLLSATVIAPDGFTADAYATYCMVIGLEEAIAFIDRTPGVEACLVYDMDGEMKTWISPGFNMKR